MIKPTLPEDTHSHTTVVAALFTPDDGVPAQRLPLLQTSVRHLFVFLSVTVISATGQLYTLDTLLATLLWDKKQYSQWFYFISLCYVISCLSWAATQHKLSTTINRFNTMRLAIFLCYRKLLVQ